MKSISKKELEEKLKQIENYCIQISNDEMAMCGEHLVADDILKIIDVNDKN